MFRQPDDKSKYSAQWKYIEFARANSKGISRLPGVFSVDDIPAELEKNGDTGFYTSVWQYDSDDIENGKRMSSLYFDLDNKEDPGVSYTDTFVLLNYLLEHIPREAIHVYFTGLKGFHVECEALALGIVPSTQNHVAFRYIANQIKTDLSLTTLDFSVYDARRMWRYPNTKHQKSGLYKVEVLDDAMTFDEIASYAAQPRELNDQEQHLDYGASKWFRGLTYKMEEETTRQNVDPSELLRRFSQYGSTSMRTSSFADREFDPKRLLDSCHTIGDLWSKAERTHHLEHIERLFLCSILSYNEEGLEYLYAILSQCNDFDPNVSKVHIEDWIRRRENGTGGRPFSCKAANGFGIGCGDCDLESKPKYIKAGDSLVATSEEALPSPVRYAYSRKGRGY